MFESLGFRYFGPYDGNNLDKMIKILSHVKNIDDNCVIHVKTVKGKGYAPAEEKPALFHGVSPAPADGSPSSSGRSFSNVMGNRLVSLAEQNKDVVAITAAMCSATGLEEFSKKFPDRFFDVGMGEEHAVTMAGGLAVSGMVPVFAVYSSFLQRAYDQILHDICLQNLHVVFCIDRAGIVAGDGVTHQGIFDYSMFSSIPNINIYSPETYAELEDAMTAAFERRELAVIRYPKGGERERAVMLQARTEGGFANSNGVENCDVVIVTYGRITGEAERVATMLSDKHSVGIIKLVRIYPIAAEEIIRLTKSAKLVYVLEEGIRSGGVGEKLAAAYAKRGLAARVVVRAIDGYLPHGDPKSLEGMCKLTANDAVSDILSALDA